MTEAATQLGVTSHRIRLLINESLSLHRPIGT